jgi:hypothetical protein
VQRNNLLALLFQIKDSSIFLGCLYFIVFIILLPEFIIRGNVINGLQMVIIGAVSVLIVHLLLNWLYIATIAAPIVVAAVFFITGWGIWLFAPLLLFALESLFKIITMFIGVNINLTLLNEFLTRLGQFLIIISGGLWWIVKKAKEINYKALTAYILLVILFGTVIGITSFTRLVGVLFVWFAIYSKVKGCDNISDLAVLFKIAATAAVTFGVFGVEVAKIGTNIISSGVLSILKTNQQSADFNVLISLYKTIIGGLIVTGIWSPGIILKRLPFKEKIWNILTKILNSRFVFIKTS